VGAIGPGLMILLGVGQSDTPAQAQALARKTAKLRLFEDDKGHFDLDLRQVGGQALVVSQFTLYAETKKGRRPSFSAAARPGLAEPLYQSFCQALADEGVEVERGVFGATMDVYLVNHGPVTLILEAE